MKPTLARISGAFAALGALVGAFLGYVGWTVRSDPHFGGALAPVYYALAALQLVPILGLLFTRNATVAWSVPKKSLWMLWVVLSLPALLLGGVAALAHVL